MEIAGKTSLYHKLVFEVRYEYGLVYLDRCGTTANRIMATHPDWIIQEEAVNPQNAPLINVRTGTQFNFGTLKYDFSLGQPINKDAALTKDDINQFVSQVEAVSQIVHEELGLKKFVRKGFRVWFLFGTESQADSQNWISSLGAFRVAPDFSKAFQGDIESEGHVAVISASDRKFRISLNAVERLEHLDLGSEVLKTLPRKLPKQQREVLLQQFKAKKRLLANPEFAVMIDVDAYVEEPIEIAPGDFICQSLSAIEEKLPKAFPGGGT